MSDPRSGQNEQMLSKLLDYHCGLDDASQRAETEALLSEDAEARKLQHALSKVLKPLASQRNLPAPDGLAEQTVAYISQHRQAQAMAKASAAIAAGQHDTGADRTKWVAWNLRDAIAIAAAIVIMFMAAKPGLNHARALSNQMACAANLHSAGLAFGNYAANYDDAMPFVACQPDEIWWRVGDTGEVNKSNTRSYYLLVKEDFLPLEGLVCRNVEEICNHIANSPEKRFELEDFVCANSLNYSFMLMFDARPKRLGETESRVVMADSNPIFSVAGCHPIAGDDQCIAVGQDKAYANSPNHDSRGQNILFCDGGVAFSQSRLVSISRDDLYTIQSNPDRYFGRETQQGDNDEFVAP
jgi:hypothetical protein